MYPCAPPGIERKERLPVAPPCPARVGKRQTVRFRVINNPYPEQISRQSDRLFLTDLPFQRTGIPFTGKPEPRGQRQPPRR